MSITSANNTNNIRYFIFIISLNILTKFQIIKTKNIFFLYFRNIFNTKNR